MHHVSRIDAGTAEVPPGYEKYSAGFRRATYVDRAMGSVHMGVGICFLEPNGSIQSHVHSFEESFYILEGSVVAQIGGESETLGPGHFGLISTGVRHMWRNPGDRPVRWLEMQAPQPRPPGYSQDTFFLDDDLTVTEASPGTAKLVGHFDESELPRPGGPSKWRVSTRRPE